jgi:hypothetical protein
MKTQQFKLEYMYMHAPRTSKLDKMYFSVGVLIVVVSTVTAFCC